MRWRSRSTSPGRPRSSGRRGSVAGDPPSGRRDADRIRSSVRDDGSSGGSMAKVRVASYAVSLDGFGAGPDQSLENPLGVGGPELFAWFFPTRTFQEMHGGEGGDTGVDDEFARRGFENVGAWILGRNMFGPVRGPWPDESWRGWWGEEPPYRVPTFVL